MNLIQAAARLASRRIKTRNFKGLIQNVKENKQMGWLQTVLGLLQLAPSILQMIAQVEALFGAGNGAAKKAVVMSATEGAPAAVTSCCIEIYR